MGVFDKFFKKKIKENQFICVKCKKILDNKYLHSNQMCADCFSETYEPKPYIKKGIKNHTFILDKRDAQKMETHDISIDKVINKKNESFNVLEYLQNMYTPYLRGIEEGINVEKFWEIVSTENLDKILDGDGYGGYRKIELLPPYDTCQPWTELLVEENGRFGVTGTGERGGRGSIDYFDTKEKALAFLIARLRWLKDK